MIGTPSYNVILLVTCIPFLASSCYVMSYRIHWNVISIRLNLISSPDEFFGSICAHRVNCRRRHNHRPREHLSFVIANWWKPLDKHAECGERLIWCSREGSRWQGESKSDLATINSRSLSRNKCFCLINNQAFFFVVVFRERHDSPR